MDVRSYQELKVWKLGMELTQGIYSLTREFPQHELYGLTSQMRRSAVSIPANLAEGHARESTKEFLRYVHIARGSLAELETFLILAENLSYASPGQIEKLLEKCTEEGKMLRGLQRSLKTKIGG